MLAKMSVMGLYRYDNSLFDSLTLPEGLDKEAFIAQLLHECQDFPLTFPDPTLFKYQLGEWCRRRIGAWTKMLATTRFEYNPIDNYDRYEEYTDQREGSNNAESNSQSTGTNSATAYDTDTFKDTDKAHNVGSSEARSTTTDTLTHKAHLRGNIGTVTTQAMIREERDIQDYDVYRQILDEYIALFCVAIY